MRETSGSTEEGSSFSSLYESLSRVTRLPAVSLLMSTLSATSTTGPVRALAWRYAVLIHTIFALGVHFDQDLLGAHDLDDFTDIGPRLLEKAKLFAQ